MVNKLPGKNNPFAFRPVILDQDSHQKRRVIKQLPNVHQTETLQKFFGSSVDHLFDPGKGKPINGYVGQKPLWYDPSQDYYLEEATSERSFYQLEASMVSKTSEGEVSNLLFYPDLINQIRFQGGLVNNHHRLFEQDYYTWCPPVDLDKIINFRQYVWIPVHDVVGTKTFKVHGPHVRYIAMGDSETDYYLPGYELVDGVIKTTKAAEFYDLSILRASQVIVRVDGKTPAAGSYSLSANKKYIRFVTPPAADAEIDIWVYSDFENNVLGHANVDPEALGGHQLSSGQRIQIQFDKNTDFKPASIYIVEGVGRSIELIKEEPSDIRVADAELPDYFTMGRGAKNGNPWSLRNRWFHVDTLPESYDPEYVSSHRAVRPIIEFNRDLELFNYGISRRDAVDLIVEGIDDIQDYLARNSSRIVVNNGKVTISTAAGGMVRIQDSVTSANLQVGALRLMIRGTSTDITNDRIYALTNQNGALITILETDGANPSGAPVYGEMFKVKYGSYAGKDLHWDGVEWIISQQKTKVNQSPLFNLYDMNGVALADSGTYPGSNFAGSRIFSYKMDRTGSRVADPVLGIAIVHDNKGQILFENYLATEQYSYVVNAEPHFIKGFYFHKIANLDPSLEVLSNDWYKADHPSRQYMVDRFVADGKNRIFQISQEPAPQDANSPANLIVTLGRTSANKNFERVELVENDPAGFIRIGREILVHNVSEGDIVEIRTFNPDNPPADATGYYEVPMNLQANPDNDEISDLSKGDFYEQFAEIIRSQEGFKGAEYSLNNWRDTPRVLNKGTHIVQNGSSLLKTMLLSSESQLDIMNAIRFSESEYTRFKDKFHQKIKEYSDNSKFVSSDAWIDAALEELNRGKTKDFPFYLSGMGYSDVHNIPSFIPATPSFLGVYPLYVPEMVTDTITDEDGNEVEVAFVRGHDGSWIQGRTIECAQVIYDLEQRIYLSAPANTRNRERPAFDWQTHYGDKFRKNAYSYDEYLSILQPMFERWAVKNGLNYRENNVYDQNDPWTWNWSAVPSVDGGKLPGHWRGIYEMYYGTQRPDLSPWEVLGFTSQPSWWISRYGPAPYTSDNTLLWKDLENGYIHEGERKGFNSAWKRPGLTNFVPVDEFGTLKNPYEAGIAMHMPLPQDARKDWVWGDLGPVEQDWRRSSAYTYAVAQAGYLMKPAAFVELGWDTKNLVKLFPGSISEQWMNQFTMGRPRNADLHVHGEILDDFSVVAMTGIQQWISDFLASRNNSINTNFANKVRGLGAQLAYKVGGFTDASNLVVVSDAFGRVPSDDVNISLYRSPSIREETYSGVAIEWTGQGYRVYGYDVLNPAFNVLPGDRNGSKITIGGSGRTDLIPTWRSATYYSVNVTVRNGENFYRCVRSHTSGSIFESSYWVNVARPQYADGTGLVWYIDQDLDSSVEKVSYGTVFKKPQEVADFLNGYARYLNTRGWIFDNLASDNMTPIDWQQSLKDFIAWSNGDNRVAGDVIFLSPGSEELKFITDQGTIQPVEQIVNGMYAIVDQLGRPILASDTNVVRSDGEIIVSSNVGNAGIFGLRLYISEVEHVLVFNNTTIFNDVIYSPVLNIHQPRLRLQGFKTVGWKGRVDAPGFIISSNSLTPNFEKAADDFRRFFDVETMENKKLQDRARANLGYEEREYLNNLLLTPTNQFEFYQGMIQQKGSPTSMRRLLRSNFIRHNKGLRLFEEWAFRVGDYGGSEILPSLDIMISQDDFKHNPQLIEFKSVTSAPANGEPGVTQIIDLLDLNGSVEKLDRRWAWRPDMTAIKWPSRKYDTLTPGVLPTAGFVNIDEVKWTAPTYIDFEKLVQTQLETDDAPKVVSGDRVWVYGIGSADKKWATYKYHNTGFGILNMMPLPMANQGSLVILNKSVNGISGVNTCSGLVANGRHVDLNKKFYLSLASSYHSGGRESVIIEDMVTSGSATGQTYYPTYENFVEAEITSTTSLQSIMNLVPEAGMYIKGITVEVIEAFASGSTLELGTDKFSGEFLKINENTPVFPDFDTNEPEYATIAPRPVYEVPQTATVADVELVRVGRPLDVCGSTVVEWSYQRVGSSTWQTGGLVEFKRPSDLEIGDESHYLQTVQLPLGALGDSGEFNIRVITNGITKTTKINVVRPTGGAFNYADLTKVGSQQFSCLQGLVGFYPYRAESSRGLNVQASVFSAGMTGRAKIRIEYFYTKGFELFQKVDGEILPFQSSSDGEGGKVMTWIPTSFDTLATVPTGVWTNGDLIEVKSLNVSQGGNNGWAVCKYNNGSWTPTRLESKKINSDLLTSAAIYSIREDNPNLVLQLYDPYKGFIPGTADREIFYKLDADPAIYNHGPVTDDDNVWGPEQVGRLWWDLSTVRYLDYEIYDRWNPSTKEHEGINYRWKNWGRIAPGSSVDIYEWTRSSVPPVDWEGFVESKSNVSVESASDKPTGQAKLSVDPSYVTRTEWNDSLQREETVYYFWVKNVATVPALVDRKLTGVQVANIITNPSSNDIPYFAIIDYNKAILGGIQQFLGDDTILKINWKNPSDIETPHHKQWMILREHDERNTIPDALWNKMRDSLVGWDTYVPMSPLKDAYSIGNTTIKLASAKDFSDAGLVKIQGVEFKYTAKSGNSLIGVTTTSVSGFPVGSMVEQVNPAPKSVPDPRLPRLQQVGNLVRPRQSWFPADIIGNGQRPSRAARATFVECLNNIFGESSLVDLLYDWPEVFEAGDPLPDQSRYVEVATDISDMKLMVTPTRNAVVPGECVLIKNTQEVAGFWTLWKCIEVNGTRDFVLEDFQKWRMQEGELWQKVDWYAKGWSVRDFPNYRFPDARTRDTSGPIDFTLLNGTLVQIDNQNPGDGRWSWDVVTAKGLTRAAIKDGTIKLKDAFFNENRVAFGPNEVNSLLNQNITPSNVAEVLGKVVENRDGSRELEFLINSIKNKLLTTVQKNEIFFTMVKCAFKENQNVDWAFKTSFLYLGGYSEDLRQSPVAFKDQIDNVIAYLEEVKPYHVKIRDYVRRLSYGPDVARLTVTDFDKPTYLDDRNGTSVYRKLEANNSSDALLMNTTRPWKDWYQNYKKENYDLKKWDKEWNPVRRTKVGILFDRVACGTIKGWDTTPWDSAHIMYSQILRSTESLSTLSKKYRGAYFWDETNNRPSATKRVYKVGDQNPFKDTSVHTIDERNMLVRNGIVTADNPGTIVKVISDDSNWMWTGKVWVQFQAQGWDRDIAGGAATRIEEHYEPTLDMRRRDDPSLISGCDFDGTIVTDVFKSGGWDMFEWGSTGWASERHDHTGLDVDSIDGNLTSTEEASDPTIINLTGDGLVQRIKDGSRPEEMVKLTSLDPVLIRLSQRTDTVTLQSVNSFNAARAVDDVGIVRVNKTRAEMGKSLLPTKYASISATPRAKPVTVPSSQLFSKNFLENWEKFNLVQSNVVVDSWNQSDKTLTITTTNGKFPFHNPKNPSKEFLDAVKLSKGYFSTSSVNMATAGQKTFKLRDVNTSKVLKEIPAGLVGKDVMVVIQNADKPSERVLAKVVLNSKGSEADNWDGTITVEPILNPETPVGDAPSNALFKAWNILPLDSYNQPGIIWVGTARFTYQDVEKSKVDPNKFILKHAYMSAASLSNLTITRVEENGVEKDRVSLTDTSKVYDGSILKRIA